MATALSGNMRCKLPSRVKVGRCASFRCGFAPKDVKSDTSYIWDQVQGPQPLDAESLGVATTWTSVQT
jgi:hypothetical protein